MDGEGDVGPFHLKCFCLHDCFFLEVLEQVQQARNEGDDEDGWEDEEDEWEDDLDRGFHGLGFDVLATAFADVVGLVLEGLAHAGTEALGLDDGGHEERDVLEAAAVGHAAHGGAAHDAHADVVLHAAALVDEGALHARGDLRERGVEGKARLHTDAEQVEHLRQLVLDLLLAALDGRIEEDDGHEAAEEPEQEDHHGLLYGRICSRADHHQRKEPHDDGAEQAAAEELGDAPLARLARKRDALLDDGTKVQRC